MLSLIFVCLPLPDMRLISGQDSNLREHHSLESGTEHSDVSLEERNSRPKKCDRRLHGNRKKKLLEDYRRHEDTTDIKESKMKTGE